MSMRVLVTGAAGFIGMHVCERLLARGDRVFGLDNLNAYYDPQLKRDRLARLLGHPGFSWHEADVADRAALDVVLALAAAAPNSGHPGGEGSDDADAEAAAGVRVIHLAAQAGVRHSITHPQDYIHSNLLGFGAILEACRQHPVRHLVYASSSSVYGSNTQLPFSPHHAADHPLTLYAATKRANELMAHAYSHLYLLPTTGLRFFTVYGPWGRPDMAPCLFARAILAGTPIEVFNQGHMARDFTYVGDVADAVVRVLDQPARPDPAFNPQQPDPATSNAPWRLYNVGQHTPVPLDTFITLLEQQLGRVAVRRLQPKQAGDVERTWADMADLIRDFDDQPATSLEDGIAHFAAWYRDYFAGPAPVQDPS